LLQIDRLINMLRQAKQRSKKGRSTHSPKIQSEHMLISNKSR
jgi:hypothetical protein